MALSLHDSTFEYLKPTEQQIDNMAILREAHKRLADTIDGYMPDGPDKTYALRKLREISMWCNVAITRNPDGSPRT